MAANLFINRLYVVTRDHRVAYDQQFHHGINIIRGENSSGKSTITHLLFFALGGVYTNFVNEAKQCESAYVEVSINDAIYTLRRQIEVSDDGRVNGMVGMTIYWGNLDEAVRLNCRFNHYGYRTLADRKSFSNVLFELMGYPIVEGDNNITFYQLLRLIYIDQESPTASLFYYEKFDNQTTREAIADLLMGIFDAELYQTKIRLKELNADLAATKSDIASVKRALQKAENLSSTHLYTIIDNKHREIESISREIDRMRSERDSQKSKKSTFNQIENQKKEVVRLRKQRLEAEQQLERLDFAIADTICFIEELQRKKAAIEHSIETRKTLGTLSLEFCPECLSPLPLEAQPGHCRLCKSPIDSTAGLTHAHRINLELTFQLQESEKILKEKEALRMKTEAKVKTLRKNYNAQRGALDTMLHNVRSSADEQVDSLIYKQGLLQGEILQYQTMLENAEYYEQLIEQRNRLESDIHATTRFVAAREAEQLKHKSQVDERIRHYGTYFLNHDLHRESDFDRATGFSVDFASNIAYADNRYSRYSASSSFYLKVVARFAIFFASLDLPMMRYPRFIFADNMEDKGIEEKRAQNFQRLIIDKLTERSDDSYQVIYTTSYITDELDHSSYVVGDHYTSGNKSLKMYEKSPKK